MAIWSEGYFTGVQYTGSFFGHLAPDYMSFACLRQGVRPPRLGPGGAYLELGCGQGFSLNLLAACHPGMEFLGVDFHPGQIANARRLAEDAGLVNVAFEDFSFEQMLALPDGRLPKFDVIALHGVYSWVSPANRAAIVRIIERHLKPGGLVNISYNTLPGWAPLIGLQRFVAEYVARHPGDPETEVVNALRAALAMAEGGSRFFRNAPTLKAYVEHALTQSPAYLIHEFVHEHCHPLFHADVARELDGARLTFAASATIGDDLLRLAAPTSLHAAIEETLDGPWRQSLIDYANDRRFRRDIFVRGHNPLGGAERSAQLAAMRFALTGPAEALKFEFPIPLGGLTGDPATYRPVVEALADGPRSFAEILALPPFASAGEAAALQAIALLVGAGHVHPVAEPDPSAEPAKAFNRAVIQRFAYDGAPAHLAAPAIGTGVRADFTDLLALDAVGRGEKDMAAAARRGWEIMARKGARLQKDGQTLPDQAANEAELAARLAAFKKARLPVLTRLGAV